jgi:MinD superfamily P-loop ATPase
MPTSTDRRCRACCGISGRPQTVSTAKTLKPMEGYGLKVMSMGFLVEEDTPMIWRGPMVISALNQMLTEVEWGELDVLVVDMPPGTGDAQLTMAQQVPLAGAVIVSTPQDLALIDARKGLNMFRKVEVPVLGIVENMSYFICPHCGERSDIFGHGGARKEAERIGVPFLGEVPLTIEIREKSDDGAPIVVKVGMITTLVRRRRRARHRCARRLHAGGEAVRQLRYRGRHRGRSAQAGRRRAAGRQDGPVRQGRRADRHHLVEPRHGGGASRDRQGKFYLSPNAGPSQLAGKGCHPNYFNVAWQNDNLHEGAGAYANFEGYKNSFILAPNYPAGKDALTGYKRFYEGELAGEVYTKLGQTDYAAEIAQIRASGADSVFFFLPGGMGISFMKQYAQRVSIFRWSARPSPSTRASCRRSAMRRWA